MAPRRDPMRQALLAVAALALVGSRLVPPASAAVPSAVPAPAPSAGEALPLDAKCGDGKCQPPEDCKTCPQDCGSCCGNGKCEPPEDCNTCPQDCGKCK
jgi:hypothetical protein